MADYQFIHHYGCEPYADNNGAGGAKLTQQNLVITAWGATDAEDSGDDPPDLSGVFANAILLIPNPDNVDLDDFTRAASKPGFHSRHSAHTYVQQNTVQQPASPVVMPVGYVLNPPPEFKQAMAGALVYDGVNDPTDLTSWTAKKSIMSQYAWRYAVEGAYERDAPQNIAGSSASAMLTRAAYSTYLHLPDPQIDTYRLPFLKTSGADGSVPLFFDPLTPEGAKEMVAAVNLGNFFVFMELAGYTPEEVGETQAERVNHTIVYPHSAARG